MLELEMDSVYSRLCLQSPYPYTNAWPCRLRREGLLMCVGQERDSNIHLEACILSSLLGDGLWTVIVQTSKDLRRSAIKKPAYLGAIFYMPVYSTH